MEMYVVLGMYDYEGDQVEGVFSDEASAMECFLAEVEDASYDAVGVYAYQGRSRRVVAYQRLSEEIEF